MLLSRHILLFLFSVAQLNLCALFSILCRGTKAKGGLLGFSFYGANIVPALLDELSADFASADQLLLTGGSAGG